MHQNYTMQRAPDQTWSILAVQTGTPVRLAGIPQTGLSRMKAEVMLEVLEMNGAPAHAKVPQSSASAAR